MTQNSKNTAPELVELSEKQQLARRKRNIAIALGLGFLVIAFYGATLAKLGPGAANKPIISVDRP